MTYRLWKVADSTAHILRRARLIPDRLCGWICNRFDLSLGVTPEELNRR